MNIIPAILPYNFEEIIEKSGRVNGFVADIQIDVCDGVFGLEKTWMPTGTEVLPQGFSYEFDLMINDWKLYTLHCLNLGAKSIVSHVDLFVDGDMDTLVGMVSAHDARLGISVSNDKSLDFHAEMIRQAKALYPNVFIQVMGIKKIGEQGQFFDEDTPGRIRALKQQFGEMMIQVDGGMTPNNLKKVRDAGAESAAVGSYIFGRDDAEISLEELNKAVNG